MRHRRLVLALVSAVCLGLLAASPASAQSGVLRPTLKCISFDVPTKRLSAFFGYISTYQAPVTVDVGPSNFFSPGTIFRNQPTVFQPGVQPDVFSTSFVFSPSLTQITWSLDGSVVTARLDIHTECTPARPRGVWSATEGYTWNDLVHHNGELWVSVGEEAPAPTPAPGTPPPPGLNPPWVRYTFQATPQDLDVVRVEMTNDDGGTGETSTGIEGQTSLVANVGGSGPLDPLASGCRAVNLGAWATG